MADDNDISPGIILTMLIVLAVYALGGLLWVVW